MTLFGRVKFAKWVLTLLLRRRFFCSEAHVDNCLEHQLKREAHGNRRMQNKFNGFVSNGYVLIALLVFAATCSILCATLLGSSQSRGPTKLSPRTLTFADRVAYQRAIEDVYWRHRIWPKERPDRKPSLDAVISDAQLERKVQDYLHDSEVLEDEWQWPISGEQLQAEMDRMAQHTKQPHVLRELFEALGNDPFLIAESVARPALVGG